MKARLLVAGLVLLAAACNAAGSHELSGELDPDGEAVHAGHAYASYSIEPSGGLLSVAVRSSNLDAYLILCSPEGTFLVNDDDNESTNARIEVSDPEEGTWTAIVTSFYESAGGAFSLVVEGASGVAPVAAADLSPELVAAAFSAGDVVTPEAERARARQRLTEQLTLLSLRRKWIDELRSEIASSDPRLLERHSALEQRKRQIEQALEEVDSLGASRDLLQTLLERELSATSVRLDRAAAAIEASAKRHEDGSIVLDKLLTLDGLSRDLLELQDRMLQIDEDREVEIRETRIEIARLKSDLQRSTEDLVARLLDPSLPQLVTFVHVDLNDSDRRRSVARRFGVRQLASLRYSANAAMLMNLSGVTTAASSLVHRSELPSEAEYSQADFSAWLPKLFPWPPPEASSRVVLDQRLVSNWEDRVKSLGDVDDLLNDALDAAGYSGPSYFGVIDGFAVVTQLEQTNADGVPLDGVARWSTEIVEMKEFSLVEYLRALLTAPPGYYRVLTFVVTSLPFSTTGDRGRFATIERWSRTGHTHLAEAVRAVEYSDEHRVTVLVYEFLKERQDDSPLTSLPGRLTAKEHLERSTLLLALQ